MWRGFVIKKFDDVANREKKMNLIIPVKKYFESDQLASFFVPRVVV